MAEDDLDDIARALRYAWEDRKESAFREAMERLERFDVYAAVRDELLS